MGRARLEMFARIRLQQMAENLEEQAKELWDRYEGELREHYEELEMMKKNGQEVGDYQARAAGVMQQRYALRHELLQACGRGVDHLQLVLDVAALHLPLQ